MRCPVCGVEQVFVPRSDAQIRRPPPPVQPTSSSGRVTTAFRKPMQAFTKGVPRIEAQTTPPPRDEVFRPDAATPPEPIPALSRTTATPSGEPPELLPEDEKGPWFVRSPTGLVLEFPSSELVVSWSAVVENPTPYQVYKEGKKEVSLAEFLRLVRQGKRGTSAYQAAAKMAVEQVSALPPSSPELGAPPNVQTYKHPTSSFQIKIKTKGSKAKTKRKWLLLGLGLFVFLGVAFTAAYFLGFAKF